MSQLFKKETDKNKLMDLVLPNGESEFPMNKNQVVEAMAIAIPTIKGMKIETIDRLQGRILVKTEAGLFSSGENITIQLFEKGENKTHVKFITSSKKNIFGGATNTVKSGKNIETILSTTSKILQQNSISTSQETSTDAGKNNLGQAKSAWQFSEVEDKMTSKMITQMFVDAEEELQFSFPYNGGSLARFTIRKKDGLTDIYLLVTNGQFANTFQDCQIRIKFDKNPPLNYSYSGSSDGSYNIIFPNAVKDIISKIKASKRMIIEAEFYTDGKRQMEFNIEGLQWK